MRSFTAFIHLVFYLRCHWLFVWGRNFGFPGIFVSDRDFVWAVTCHVGVSSRALTVFGGLCVNLSGGAGCLGVVVKVVYHSGRAAKNPGVPVQVPRAAAENRARSDATFSGGISSLFAVFSRHFISSMCRVRPSGGRHGAEHALVRLAAAPIRCDPHLAQALPGCFCGGLYFLCLVSMFVLWVCSSWVGRLLFLACWGWLVK